MGPLTGMVVLDAGNMIAGPMAAALLADYGATVIKIEHPKLGDPLRSWEPTRDGRPLWWKVTARNKRLVTLNLGIPEGRDLLLDLVRDADVLIENFRAGTFERWGLDYATLASRNPGLVFLRISGFGQTGPYRHKPGYGTIAEAMSGIPSFTGDPDGPPSLPGFPMADSVSAVFGAYACVSAIYRRDHDGTGLGQEIDLALYESLFRIVESQVISYDQVGHVKQRVGNRLEEDAPRNAYPTADGKWVAVSASSDRTWQRFTEAIGAPELAEDPRFATSPQRVRNVEELDAIISAWFARHPAEAALEILDRHDAVAGPVLDIADIFEHEHYRARGNVVDVPDEDFGSVKMPAPVPRFLRTPCRLESAGGRAGRDNDHVYGDLLGLSAEQRHRLTADGVI